VISIPSWFNNWCEGNYNGHYPRFENIKSATYDVETEEDSDYSKPFILNSQNNWYKEFKDLPVQSTDTSNGYVYHYEYYIEEINVPKGFKAVYYNSNNQIINNPTNYVTNTDESFKVVNRQDSIDIKLKKVDIDDISSNEPKTLENASFELIKYISEDFQEKDTSWQDLGVMNINETDISGVFKASGLSEGYYKIVEINVPKGYIKLSEDPKFRVTTNSTNDKLEIVLYSDSNNDDSISNMIRIDNKTVIFGNEQGVALPNTGGHGTKAFTVIGSLLFIGAGILLIKRRIIV
jgi:LPXTG-motif cell wall-anchored protein